LTEPGETAPALVRAIEHVMRLHGERCANAALAAALDRLGEWQARRLRQTYSDLAADARYVEAIAFFESDLYGSGDFARRDADLARIVPIMVRGLPQKLIAAVAEAMELNALSQELDRALLAKLPRLDSPLTVAGYCAAYCETNDRAGRERQIRLIATVGGTIDSFVGKPLVRVALAAMRKPAKIAGLSALQGFLERGFHAFRRMRGASRFLATIVDRETALMNAILGGDASPFTDPWRP